MGCVKNITYDIFPQQKKDLGTTVNLGLNGERVVPAVVVRSDAESPNRQIFRTSEGLYVQASELDDIQFPKQGDFIGKKAKVCFHYKADRNLEGKIVRDDMAEPYLTLIELEDGRVISTGECQYQAVFDIPVSQEKIKTPAIKDIELVERQLRKRNSAGKVKLLSGIYKQLVLSRKGKISNGHYNNKYSLYQKGHQHIVQTGGEEGSLEQVANKITQHVAAQKFVQSLIDEMRKYNELQNHVRRLEEEYLGSMQLDMLGGSSKPIQIKRL